MFVEIRKKYMEDPPIFPMVVCTLGSTLFQSAIERPEGFQYHQLLLVEEGEGIFTVGEECFPVTAGQGIFTRKNVPHSYRATGERFRTRWVSFLGGDGVLDYYKIERYFLFRAEPLFLSATDALEQVCLGNSTVLTRSAAGYTWLVDWLHGCFSPSAPLAVQVRRYLEAHFAEPVTLDRVAEAVHMSRYALCHYYKDSDGCTVMEQLRQIRIAKAQLLLQMTNTSVEEIGRSCGFESPSYFGKIFRQQVGCSPREYRNNKLKGEYEP